MAVVLAVEVRPHNGGFSKGKVVAAVVVVVVVAVVGVGAGGRGVGLTVAVFHELVLVRFAISSSILPFP